MKVWPKTDALRKALRHPTAGVLPTDDAPGDWPDDSFTYRLVRDGDLLTEPPTRKPAKETKESTKEK